MSRELSEQELETISAQAFRLVTGGHSTDHFTPRDHEILGRRVAHVARQLEKIPPQIRTHKGHWSAGGVTTTMVPFRGENPPQAGYKYTPNIPTYWG